MRPDEMRALRDQMSPPWDDLREQRVLRGALAARDRRARARRTLGVGVLAAAAVLAVLAVVGISIGRRHPAPEAAGAAPPPGPMPSVLTLTDGSRLAIQPHASVRVESDAAGEVRLEQSSGEVAYDVAHRPQRSFVVRAAGVVVRVKGTAFTLRVSAEAVWVRVDRGRVAVEDASGAMELGAGEEVKRVVRPPLDTPAAPSAGAPPASASVASPAPPAPSADPGAEIDALLRDADRARAAGRLDEAATLLEQIRARHPKDRRMGSVLFTLGRVERARGNPAQAAAIFRACASGPLGEDALAEEAGAWAAAGRPDAARDAASRYLARFPSGPHATRMKKLAGPAE